jgi:hypothetical protein
MIMERRDFSIFYVGRKEGDQEMIRGRKIDGLARHPRIADMAKTKASLVK